MKNRKGYTLIEAMIAIVILGGWVLIGALLVAAIRYLWLAV